LLEVLGVEEGGGAVVGGRVLGRRLFLGAHADEDREAAVVAGVAGRRRGGSLGGRHLGREL
jgi:hypothetical protein